MVLTCHDDHVWDITCKYLDIRSIFTILHKKYEIWPISLIQSVRKNNYGVREHTIRKVRNLFEKLLFCLNCISDSFWTSLVSVHTCAYVQPIFHLLPYTLQHSSFYLLSDFSFSCWQIMQVPYKRNSLHFPKRKNQAVLNKNWWNRSIKYPAHFKVFFKFSVLIHYISHFAKKCLVLKSVLMEHVVNNNNSSISV
jgi:hypothetical protein